MKKAILILAAVCITVMTYAQSFQQGTTAINAGIGIGTALGGLGSARPAISLSLDHGKWAVGGPGVISLGGYLGNTGYKYTDAGYTAKWNYYVVGVRGAYHYNGFEKLPKLDVYGGATLAYNIVKYSSDNNDDHLANSYGSGIGLSGFLGSRWFFSDNIGAFAELGYGVSTLNIGITFKL